VASKEGLLVLLSVLGYMLLRFLWRQALLAHCFFSSRQRALAAVKRDPTRDGPREGSGLWLTKPTFPPENYEDTFGTRVLVIANNKGGVAKTTLAANLGAYWAKEWKKRVLLIDLDFQGTLSNMCLGASTTGVEKSWTLPGQDSLATRAISGDLEPSIFVHCAKQVNQDVDLKIIPAYYDLAQAG